MWDKSLYIWDKILFYKFRLPLKIIWLCKKSRLLKINKRDWKCLDLYIAIAACTQFSYLLIKPLVLDRLHGNSYEISAYKEIH